MASLSSIWWNPDAPVNTSILGALKGNSTPAGPTVSDQYAALTRENWNDYLNVLGVPQENQLIDYATNPDTVTNAMADASKDVGTSFQRQAGITQQRLSSQGLSLAPDEQAAADRSTSLAQATADVGAQNRARDQTIARQQSILGAPAPTITGQ